MEKSEKTLEQDRNRLLKIIKYHNPNFTELELDNLISRGSIDYFYSAVNKRANTLTEESDAEIITDLFSKIRES